MRWHSPSGQANDVAEAGASVRAQGSLNAWFPRQRRLAARRPLQLAVNSQRDLHLLAGQSRFGEGSERCGWRGAL